MTAPATTLWRVQRHLVDPDVRSRSVAPPAAFSDHDTEAAALAAAGDWHGQAVVYPVRLTGDARGRVAAQSAGNAPLSDSGAPQVPAHGRDAARPAERNLATGDGAA